MFDATNPDEALESAPWDLHDWVLESVTVGADGTIRVDKVCRSCGASRVTSHGF